MTTFTRYHCYYLNLWVEAADQQEVVEGIKVMGLEEVEKIRTYLLSELHTPGYSNRGLYEQRCNILFLTAINKRHSVLSEAAAQPQPMGWMKTCAAIFTGLLVGEVVSTALINRKNVMAEEATLRGLQIKDLTK